MVVKFFLQIFVFLILTKDFFLFKKILILVYFLRRIMHSFHFFIFVFKMFFL